jgi:DNA-binding NtrC family response regulator
MPLKGYVEGIPGGRDNRPILDRMPGSAVGAGLAPGVLHARSAGESDGPAPAAMPMTSLHLLVVDDDDSVRGACCEIARHMGFVVFPAASTAAAREMLKHQSIDVVLLDLTLPGGNGIDLLEETKMLHPQTNVVIMTAYATVSSAVEAMRIGAANYLTKPFTHDELTATLEEAGRTVLIDAENRELRERLRTQKGPGQLVGSSPEMEKLYRIISKVAQSNHPLLILGEEGTGKERVARSIHFNGAHAGDPFLPVDCGTLAPASIESEFFGHVKGAIAGASRARDGFLVAAGNGTVYLDEVSELPLEIQGKLMRALQEKAVHPIGSASTVPISARVLAGTKRDLNAMVEQGRFRKDLYFRLNVVNLRIPPLRDRRGDIAELAQACLDLVERETGVRRTLSDDAMRMLVAYDWPGNLGELEHALQRAVELSSGPAIQAGDLPTPLVNFFLQMRRDAAASREPRPAAETNRPEGANGAVSTLEARAIPPGAIVSIAEMEKQAILGAIRNMNGDKLMAAKLLGIGKTTLYRKLKEYGIAASAESPELQDRSPDSRAN